MNKVEIFDLSSLKSILEEATKKGFRKDFKGNLYFDVFYFQKILLDEYGLVYTQLPTYSDITPSNIHKNLNILSYDDDDLLLCEFEGAAYVYKIVSRLEILLNKIIILKKTLDMQFLSFELYDRSIVLELIKNKKLISFYVELALMENRISNKKEKNNFELIWKILSECEEIVSKYHDYIYGKKN